MVFILPKKFRALVIEDSDEEEPMAQLTLGPMPAVFGKPEEGKFRHLKPLYLR
jgi:hypothetical protein